MTPSTFFLITNDNTLSARFDELAAHWAARRLTHATEIDALPEDCIVIIDTGSEQVPAISDQRWHRWARRKKLVFISSQPNDDEGLAMLELGASAYCHAYAAPATLRQVLDVVASGELWVGRSLMSRLLRGVGMSKPLSTAPVSAAWRMELTDRETEVARLAADAQTNQDIAVRLGITERTVKAHLTTIFAKLGIADRLQLALKVHGIR